MTKECRSTNDETNGTYAGLFCRHADRISLSGATCRRTLGLGSRGNAIVLESPGFNQAGIPDQL